MRKLQETVAVLVAMLLPAMTHAQGVKLSGSVQSDMLFPVNDSKTNAVKNGDFNTNTYVDLTLQSTHIDAGARVEYMDYPLPGFESDFKGKGLSSGWLKLSTGDHSLTLGTFYEQFGVGFILRTYEERSLGIDNSLLGGRVVVKPLKGLTLKALTGVQRTYWSWNGGWISGADGELALDEVVPSMQQKDVRLSIGASWVNKYEKDEDVPVDALGTLRLNLPKYVNAWDVRANLNTGPWTVLAEYAQKSQDPSASNGYIYKNGMAALLSATYSKHGLSVLLQAKRSENMAFRSQRSRVPVSTAGYLNHLPAFTQDHTYALAALYPYATQLVTGEWAYQAEAGYLFKRKTPIGGRYGMNVKLNYSYVRAIDQPGTAAAMGTDGHTSSFFKWGDQTYYQDLNVQLSRRLSRRVKLNVMYMNQRYNKTVVEGEGGMIHSDIFVADALFQLAPKTQLRTELQYLATAQDQGDWAFGLAELSLAPHWMLTVSDMYNCGKTKTHYYQALATCNIGSHRIQAGYGRTRAGYNCSGGVCRYVPATTGFTLNYNYNF